MGLGGTLADVVGGAGSQFDAVGGALKDLFGNPISMPGMSAAEGAAQQKLLSQSDDLASRSASMKGIADPLFDAFKTGTLTPAQQAELDLARGSGLASIEQNAASAGISNSSFAASQRAQFELQVASMKDSLLKGDFTEAMQAMGLSDQELGMSGEDLGRILGYGQQQQQIGLQADIANQQQKNAMIGEIGQFAMAGALLFNSPGAGSPTHFGDEAAGATQYEGSASDYMEFGN